MHGKSINDRSGGSLQLSIISYTLLLSLLTILLTSCGTNRMRDGSRVGKWIEKDAFGDQQYTYISKYGKNGKEKGKWRTLLNGEIYKTERFYRNNQSEMRFYYPGKKLRSIGMTRIDVTQQGKTAASHWYYSGDWRFYKISGELECIKTYHQGVLIAEVNK